VSYEKTMTGADKVITRVIPIRAQRFQFAVTVAVPFRELGRWVMWLVQRFQFAVTVAVPFREVGRWVMWLVQRFQFAVTVAVPFREVGRWVMWLVQRFQFAVMPLILSMGTAHTAEQIDATIRRDRYLVSSILC